MKAAIGRIEQETLKKSLLHQIDGRIKLIITVFLIIYAVYTTDVLVLIIMEIYLLILILLSRISLSFAAKRILLILPFGGFIAVSQLFIKPGEIIFTFPIGVTITYEGTMFGILLFSRLLVCVTAIVLLSSVTPLQDLINSARKLGMPKEFSMLLSLMIRYLFMFYEEYLRIKDAQSSRCFNIWNKKLSYRWRMKQIGYTIMMMFLRSFEHGENVYFSMLSRGYSDKANLYNYNQKLGFKEIIFLSSSIIFVISLEFMQIFSLI